MLIARILAFVAGLFLVSTSVSSAIRTFVLPRSARDPLTRIVFLGMRALFELRLKRVYSYSERDRVMAIYAPITLIFLPVVLLSAVLVGFMCIYWALGQDWFTAFKLSGSSLLTLGFATADDVILLILIYIEATIGLILVALLIAYLPTMYSAFSRREAAVTMLEVRAGTPPSAVEMLKRFYRLDRLKDLHEVWTAWELWFAEIEENHTSLAPLTFFRSPQPDHSWVTAAGTILDAASLLNAAVDVPHDPRADLCIRAGYLALRRISDFFNVAYAQNPTPTDPISISREEFDVACDELAAAGLPMRADRDTAWANFTGWRVNYDTVLISLAAMTMAPFAPWSSDRSIPGLRTVPLRFPWERN